MHLCYGAEKHQISMRNSVDYTMGDLLSLCEKFERSHYSIFLEYEANLYIALDTHSRMEMGAEMVANYHELVKPKYDESTWLEPTGSRWMTQLWEHDAFNDIDYDDGSGSESDIECN
jgi:hypothetical protein